MEEEEESFRRADSAHMRSNSSDEDLGVKGGLEFEDNDVEDSNLERNNSAKEVNGNAMEMPQPKPKPLTRFGSRLTSLQIPSKEDFIERLKSENRSTDLELNNSPPESPADGYETAEELFSPEEVPGTLIRSSSNSSKDLDIEIISGESVLETINSVKGTKSYQLGKQLSCKWSTGAGPRIGCVREYPSELQFHALEQVNLSPRSAGRLRLNFPFGESTPSSLSRQLRTPHSQISKPCRTHSSPLCRYTMG